MDKLILIGAGGYAKAVLDSYDFYNYEMSGFLDEFKQLDRHLGYPVLGKSLDDIKDADSYKYFVSIGNNIQRKIWYDRLTERGLKIINVIDHSAIVSKNAVVGNGCYIGKLAIINSHAEIRDNCIVNTKALVEHGCLVESHANISTNSILNGDVHVGIGSYIGSSSVVNGQLSIGNWAVVGSGAVVTHEVTSGDVVVGIPARFLKKAHEDIIG